MCEHDIFLSIYSALGFLKELEKQDQTDDNVIHAIIDVTRSINMCIVAMQFNDTLVYDSGEVVPGEIFHEWYEKWFRWFFNMEAARFSEFNDEYIEGRDISKYLPTWYDYENREPILNGKTSNIA
jgi:hypothetical protein